MAVDRNQLIAYLNELLTPQLFEDYGPNGLQVEGTKDILNWFFHSDVPSDKCVIPSSRVNQILVSFLCVELPTVNSVGVGIIRRIGIFQLAYGLSLHFIVNFECGVVACHNQHCSISVVV